MVKSIQLNNNYYDINISNLTRYGLNIIENDYYEFKKRITTEIEFLQAGYILFNEMRFKIKVNKEDYIIDLISYGENSLE